MWIQVLGREAFDAQFPTGIGLTSEDKEFLCGKKVWAEPSKDPACNSLVTVKTDGGHITLPPKAFSEVTA